MLNNLTICGTGHRPDKLGGYTDEAFKKLTEFIKDILAADKPGHVISGMALGFDQALATAAMELSIPWTAALPVKEVNPRWFPKSKAYHNFLLTQATKIHVVCEGGYAAWKLQSRNKWMVDNSHVVLALWNGSSGGTANCVTYANQTKKPVFNAWPDWTKR